jgi:hypothetical protein
VLSSLTAPLPRVILVDPGAATMKLKKQFKARLRKGANPGSWTYLVMPDSAAFS